MLVVEGFQKFAVIPFGISRIFESLMPQQTGANRRKNRSIQVLIKRQREVNMKTRDKKKKLMLNKVTISQLDKGKIIEVKDALQHIRGGGKVKVTDSGSSCPTIFRFVCS
jgi:hypothetical protein